MRLGAVTQRKFHFVSIILIGLLLAWVRKWEERKCSYEQILNSTEVKLTIRTSAAFIASLGAYARGEVIGSVLVVVHSKSPAIYI